MSNRQLALQGALNFRDLGGYSAHAGRRVRWRMLYRSGTTHALTAADLEALGELNIRQAFDLRSTPERLAQPNRLVELANVEYGYRDHDALPGNVGRLLRAPDCRGEHTRHMMRSMYRQLPYEFESAIGTLFQHLIAGRMPLVFNCTAGKDRTGVTAALILAALGVARDDILEDYLLTEAAFERSCELLVGDAGAGLFRGVPREAWEPLMRAHPDYLHAMFDTVDGAHGSVERYLAERLGVGTAAVERLRDNLLE